MSTKPSLPLRECGLKLKILHIVYVTQKVTPLAGVWIEIITCCPLKAALYFSHSPCGSVD